jgi:2-methylcitrate dehydratase PrpD
MAASISDQIATHLAEVRFEQLPEAAVVAAKRSLLDALGVMLGASGLGEGCDAFAALAREESPDGPCQLWGYGTRAALLPAVLANGALAHALDFEDAFDEAPCHPNAALVPAALALAQSRGPVSGSSLITAIAAGCDLVCRLAMSLRSDPAERGWYWPPIFGAFGAAACAGRLLELDPVEMRDALSLTLCQSTCSAELKYSRRSVVRAVRDGFSAHAGLVSALLAQRGVAGFEQPLEGRAGLYALYAQGQWEPEALTQRLGSHFYGAEVSFKPWPSCRGTHALIEAALELRQAPGLHLAAIERLRTHGGPVQQMLTEPRAQKLRPHTAIDAKFSIPFTVAAALVHGEVTLQSFGADALANPEVLALAERVSFQVESTAADPTATAGALEIVMNDGRVLAKRVTHPRGHYSNPLSWQELRAKFEMCAAEARIPLRATQNTRLVQFIQDLEQQRDATKALAAILDA